MRRRAPKSATEVKIKAVPVAVETRVLKNSSEPSRVFLKPVSELEKEINCDVSFPLTNIVATHEAKLQLRRMSLEEAAYFLVGSVASVFKRSVKSDDNFWVPID